MYTLWLYLVCIVLRQYCDIISCCMVITIISISTECIKKHFYLNFPMICGYRSFLILLCSVTIFGIHCARQICDIISCCMFITLIIIILKPIEIYLLLKLSLYVWWHPLLALYYTLVFYRLWREIIITISSHSAFSFHEQWQYCSFYWFCKLICNSARSAKIHNCDSQWHC